MTTLPRKPSTVIQDRLRVKTCKLCLRRFMTKHAAKQLCGKCKPDGQPQNLSLRHCQGLPGTLPMAACYCHICQWWEYGPAEYVTRMAQYHLAIHHGVEIQA